MATKAKLKTSTKIPAKVAEDNDNALGSALVPMPKAGALSPGAGMEALRHLAAFADDEQMITDLRTGIQSHRGKAQIILAMSIHKAALADKGIDLTMSLMSEKTHKSEKNILGKQVRLALGLMEVKNGKTVLTDEAAAMQNQMPGDDERTLKRKKSIRGNFSTMLTKAMRVALFAVEHGVALTIDQNYLRLTDTKKSGNAVQKHFGMASVLLNEDQNAPVIDKKGKPTGATKALKVLPSFTEVTRAAGASHGIVIEARKDSRASTPKDANAHVVEVAENLVKAINNLPKDVPDTVTKALEQLRNAISVRLD